MTQAALEALTAQVRSAIAGRRALRIRAGGTKDFYGQVRDDEVLDPRVYRGIVAYEPAELVITARAGTPLEEIEGELASRGQMLSFEPPRFGFGTTFGGCIAAGIAGPRRASHGTAWGGVRDFVLGAKLLDGRAQVLSFGGTVIKNVAGYDVSRVLAGSLGILGVILEISVKVLPVPAQESTLRFEMSESHALECLNRWGGQPLPISASAWRDGLLCLRLSGAGEAVSAARRSLGGEPMDADVAADFWQDLRDHTHSFFRSDGPLWRLSLPSTAPPLLLESETLLEWSGAQRWLFSKRSTEAIRACASEHGGHATLFRRGDHAGDTFSPLSPVLAALHARLKSEFDPASVFNPGRMYAQL